MSYDPPRDSMMEWKVICRADSAGGKKVRVARSMAYIKPSGKTEILCDLFEKLMFVLFRVAHRSGVNYAAKVLVQRFHSKVYIPLQESLIPFDYEFDLRGA